MKSALKRLSEKLSWDTATRIFAAAIYSKFILFDLIWCVYTSYTSLSKFATYFTPLMVTLTLLLPWVLTRRRWVGVTVLLMLDMLLVANLMYFRTYFSAIPPSSYLIAGNLTDFTDSVIASLRWCDLLFLLTTVAAAAAAYKVADRRRPTGRKAYLAMYIAVSLIVGAPIVGGGPRSYLFRCYQKNLSSAHEVFCCTPMFTVFGTLFYELNRTSEQCTDAERAEIEEWLSHSLPPVGLPDGAEPRRNCVLIIVESLESWPVGLTVEGNEIMPNLNRAMRESPTLYAPHVLTQTNGGRSIDAQLLILSGLLPIKNGTYSGLYHDNTYYTLQKAMKELRGSRNYLITVDKTKTWNQGMVARSFGTDTIVSSPDFNKTELIRANRMGDRQFLLQTADKMRNGELWPAGETAFVQIVTYSMHMPFVTPAQLRGISFSPTVPKVMNDYLTAANYTDKGLGILLDYLRSRPDYDDTLIVITGDHEGLATYRTPLCESDAGRGIVSEHPYTPFIVLNSPVAMRCDNVMGQIDIYPTLLDLLGLNDYRWHGLGRSILDPGKPSAAVNHQLAVDGRADDADIDRLRHAFGVSDMIIRFDYFSRVETANEAEE